MTEAEALTRKIVEIFDIGAVDLILSVIAPEYVDHQGLGGGMVKSCGSAVLAWSRGALRCGCLG